MKFTYLFTDDTYTFMVKGFVDLEEFMSAVRKEVSESDPILLEEPEHVWIRDCRDFAERRNTVVEARPGSRGAYLVTWIRYN